MAPELRALAVVERRIWGDAEVRGVAIERIVDRLDRGAVPLLESIDILDRSAKVGLAALGLPREHIQRVRVEMGPVLWAGRTDPDGTLNLSAIAMRQYVRINNLPDAVFRIWVHESLHGRRAFAHGYRLEAARVRGYEEGMVEGLARSILRAQGIRDIGGTFEYFVAAYRALADELTIDVDVLWRKLWQARPGDVRATFPSAVQSLLRSTTARELSEERLARLRGIADTVFRTDRSGVRPSAAELTRLWKVTVR